MMPIVKLGVPLERVLFRVDNALKMLDERKLCDRTQDLIPAFKDAGQWYFVKILDFLAAQTILGMNPLPFIVGEHECHDIDYPDDWELAEYKFNFFRMID